MVKMQVSIICGVMVAVIPLMIEAWLFIKPALKRNERKVFYALGPMILVLFVFGAATALWVMPAAIRWFASYSRQQGIPLRQNTKQLVTFVAMMCLAFGGAFQLPTILMALGKVGLIRSRDMIAYWRHAIVALAVIAAVITPSNDAPTMILMALPLIVLYGLSIILVRIVEPRGARSGDR